MGSYNWGLRFFAHIVLWVIGTRLLTTRLKHAKRQASHSSAETMARTADGAKCAEIEEFDRPNGMLTGRIAPSLR